MTPAEIATLRVCRKVRPKRKRHKHRPKPRSGEVEFFEKLKQWRVPHLYEPLFFPLEFYDDGQTKMAFQPDARLIATRRYPEVFVELSLGGYNLVEQRVDDLATYVRLREEKQIRIKALYHYYGHTTVLVDGPLLDEIVNGSNGYERLIEAIDEAFDPAWEHSLIQAA